jgi:hypothetical protein
MDDNFFELVGGLELANTRFSSYLNKRLIRNFLSNFASYPRNEEEVAGVSNNSSGKLAGFIIVFTRKREKVLIYQRSCKIQPNVCLTDNIFRGAGRGKPPVASLCHRLNKRLISLGYRNNLLKNNDYSRERGGQFEAKRTAILPQLSPVEPSPWFHPQ